MKSPIEQAQIQKDGKPVLSVIIVNYHSGEVIDDCLASIFNENIFSGLEIFVVNNSPDDTFLGKVLEKYPTVSLLESGYNAGFARANNLGISRSGGEYVLLLNSDTILPHGVLKYFIDWMAAHTDYAACGSRLIYPDGRTQISGNFALRGGLNYLLMIPFLAPILKGIANLLNIKKTNISSIEEEVEDVDWINGAFLMVRRKAILEAGTLDPDFFLYHEESEWCSRLKKSGKLGVLGRFAVIHIEGYSSNNAFQSDSEGHNTLFDKKGKQLFVSLLVRLRKEFGAGWLFFHLLAFTLTVPVVLLLGIFYSMAGLIANKRQPYSRYLHYALNILSSWKFVPHLLINRPYFYKVI